MKQTLTCDAHVDSLWVLSGLALQQHPTVDLQRMQFGGLDRAVLALYISDPWQDRLGEARTWNEIAEQLSNTRIYFPHNFIALEGGRCLGSNEALALGRLNELAAEGIKYLTIVHNNNNLLAGSATDHTSEQGLTRFGRNVLDECERLNVLIDISHASDLAVNDILQHITSKPLIASHSGCRSVLKHPRNLSDYHIIQVALTGGVVCVPFVKNFVDTMVGVAHHIDYICQLTGSCRHVGIGSDLDGAVMVHGVTGAESWSTVVVDQLIRRGYTDEHISLIAGGNLLRLFGEVDV